MPSTAWLPLLTALRERIVGLELAGIARDNIVVQIAAADRGGDLPLQRRPAVLLAPHAAERLDGAAGTNLRDEVVYPVLVALLADERGDPAEDFEQFTRWRGQLCTALHRQRLPAAGCHLLEVEPLELVDRAVWSERQLWLSCLVVHCHTRELRN